MKLHMLTTSVLALALSASVAAAGGKMDPIIEPAPVAPPPPTAPAYDWTGFYVGGHLGAGRADIDVIDRDGYNGIDGAGDFDYSTDTGLIGGVQAGYNLQSGNFVYGIEGELGYMDLDGSEQFPDFQGDPARVDDSVAAIEMGAYGTLTGRAGFAADNVLFYAKGGVAAARAEVSYTDPNPTGVVLDSGTSAKETMTGWTLGGGVEYGVSQNFTVKAEYMYMDLGDITHTATTPQGSEFRFKHEVTAHTFKIGANYRF